MLVVYSSLLLAALVVGAPYWLVRMATSGRYRAGLAGRLGRVPKDLQVAVSGRDVVWLHAVSVGEVMAATRLVRELEAALPGWVVAVSTTTATGQALAKQRLAGSPVFYLPLDFAFVVRRYLRVLQPKMLVLMESEFWPRLMEECAKNGVPVVVANARISDRSFPRYMRLRRLWRPLLEKVSLYLAQSRESAERLVKIGAPAERVRMVGNLKYDVRTPGQSWVAELVLKVAAGRPIIVAGSTVDRKQDKSLSEDEMVIQAWEGAPLREMGAMLVLAPRHPERFTEVESVAMEFRLGKMSELDAVSEPDSAIEILLLDTIGDLAAVYGVADVAFVGGSLVQRGGHNPLEPAQFGVPVVMGSSYENFRDVVSGMQAINGIRVVKDVDELRGALTELLQDQVTARAMGERGRTAFEAQAGATARTVEMLMELLRERAVGR